MGEFLNSSLGRVLVALFVPVAWGVCSAWLFDRLRARRACDPPKPRRAGGAR